MATTSLSCCFRWGEAVAAATTAMEVCGGVGLKANACFGGVKQSSGVGCRESGIWGLRIGDGPRYRHLSCIMKFSEKAKDADLDATKDDGTYLRFSPQDTSRKFPYIASMGVYVLLMLLRWKYPKSNDFGSEILPYAVKEHNVQAFVFNDYWEDIGAIRSFFDANLALTEQFYDPMTPFYTSPRFLPPTKIDKCRIVDAIVSHGCFLRECSVEHSVVGVRSRLDCGSELKDTMMMGADIYETEAEIAALFAEDKVPIGVEQNTKISNCVVDMNARIGKNVTIINKDGLQEADRPCEGFYIRSGITVIMKNATVKDSTVI